MAPSAGAGPFLSLTLGPLFEALCFPFTQQVTYLLLLVFRVSLAFEPVPAISSIPFIYGFTHPVLWVREGAILEPAIPSVRMGLCLRYLQYLFS